MQAANQAAKKAKADEAAAAASEAVAVAAAAAAEAAKWLTLEELQSVRGPARGRASPVARHAKLAHKVGGAQGDYTRCSRLPVEEKSKARSVQRSVQPLAERQRL